MAIRVENLSGADQELAPGSGFVPAKGFRDYPADEYREQHEKYARARLEAEPPILKVSEVSDEEAGFTKKTTAQAQTEQNADDARKAEEQRRIEELRKRQAELEGAGDQKAPEDTRRRK